MSIRTEETPKSWCHLCGAVTRIEKVTILEDGDFFSEEYAEFLKIKEKDGLKAVNYHSPLCVYSSLIGPM